MLETSSNKAFSGLKTKLCLLARSFPKLIILLCLNIGSTITLASNNFCTYSFLFLTIISLGKINLWP